MQTYQHATSRNGWAYRLCQKGHRSLGSRIFAPAPAATITTTTTTTSIQHSPQQARVSHSYRALPAVRDLANDVYWQAPLHLITTASFLLVAVSIYQRENTSSNMTEENGSHPDQPPAALVAGQWDADMLMGKKTVEGLDIGESMRSNGLSPSSRKSSFRFTGAADTTKDAFSLWGLPGHLTEEECAVYFKFRDEVVKRGGDFRDTVYCFGEEEGEVWALCRWLRARKFDYDAVVTMVDEATKSRAEAKAKGFYPDPVEALGCEAALFFAQYPQLYHGVAKNGVPLFISKPGILNVDGMECITNLDGMIRFHWYIMMHDFADRLRSLKKADPLHFNRFECFIILDLDHLTTAQLTSRALAIIKEQSAIDSLCFPETMSKMLIVNAPRFFALTWRLIKGWLDPRTAGKVEVISSRSHCEKRLLELVDEDILPSDYGGKGPSSNDILMKSNPDGMTRMYTEMIYLRGHDNRVCEVHADESLEFDVFTRSPGGAKFSLVDADHKNATPWVENVTVAHDGTSEHPARVRVTTTKIDGPAKVKVKAESLAGRKSQSFLAVYSFHPKN